MFGGAGTYFESLGSGGGVIWGDMGELLKMSQIFALFCAKMIDLDLVNCCKGIKVLLFIDGRVDEVVDEILDEFFIFDYFMTKFLGHYLYINVFMILCAKFLVFSIMFCNKLFLIGNY